MAICPGVNEPVLIYATCEQTMLIYYNLHMNSVSAHSLQQKINLDPELVDKFKTRGVDGKFFVIFLPS